MLPILLSVFVISFAGAVLPGPLLAVTLAKSHKSPWAGFQVGLGHAAIEIPLIVLIYFGFGQFFQNETIQFVLSTLGGSLTIWLGIIIFRARATTIHEGRDLRQSAFTFGVLASILNPMFFVWWVTIGAMFIMKFHEFGLIGLMAFIVAHELPDLGWYSFASVVAHRSHSLWGPKFQEWVFTACGLLLVSFGFWFLLSGIQILA